jgi:hypothetical protein
MTNICKHTSKYPYFPIIPPCITAELAGGGMPIENIAFTYIP